jgi:hypothetical protein
MTWMEGRLVGLRLWEGIVLEEWNCSRTRTTILYGREVLVRDGVSQTLLRPGLVITSQNLCSLYFQSILFDSLKEATPMASGTCAADGIQ